MTSRRDKTQFFGCKPANILFQDHQGVSLGFVRLAQATAYEALMSSNTLEAAELSQPKRTVPHEQKPYGANR